MESSVILLPTICQVYKQKLMPGVKKELQVLDFCQYFVRATEHLEKLKTSMKNRVLWGNTNFLKDGDTTKKEH